MQNTVEIRWHGRGGQGAKTACLLLADAAFSSGKYVQGFPEYGPERMGAPITAYNRISDERCTVHSNIYDPDYVVVVDESLIETVDVTKGLNPEGAIIVNTPKSPAEVRKELGNFPNPPMPAAAVKVSGVVDADQFVSNMEASFKHKFATKPQVIAGNMTVLTKSMQEVQVG